MQLAQGWSVAVDRGPDWLFVSLKCDDQLCKPVDLAENLWELLQCHSSHRMVLELEEVGKLDGELLTQIAQLGKRLGNAEGVLRLCGVNTAGQESIRAAGLDRQYPCYADRAAAVLGERPRQPR